MLPLGATLMPGSVTVAPGMATGVMKGPDAPAPVVPATPPRGETARATRAATAAFRLQRDLTPEGTPVPAKTCANLWSKFGTQARVDGSHRVLAVLGVTDLGQHLARRPLHRLAGRRRR